MRTTVTLLAVLMKRFTFVLRLRRRPVEGRAGRQALEEVVAGIRPGRREGDVEVEGVGISGCERPESGRADCTQRAVVESGAAVDVLVDLQVELACERCTTGRRAGERVHAGESSGIRDRDRAAGRVADLHRRGVED